ncbi:helix-turn-helix domain-containing protein [uncultured Clostridium sp.]|uniref:helix-turn-helix domain-containing protein n=1 Tax=uncultured Clostridium sp. TaxID=59620 RepID=UPI0025EEDC05|nr:helix-turn-helix domain-containing protein [uncultured Clostridium sp.]
MNKNVLRELKNHGTESFPCGLYVNDSNKERFIVKHHWHKQIEMIHLKKGKFVVEINMDKRVIEDECFCFINSEELHYIESIHSCAESAVVFDLKMLSFDMMDSIEMNLIRPMINGNLKLPSVLYVKDKCSKMILNEYERIMESFRSEGPLSEKIEGNKSENISSQIKIKAALLNILAILYENNMIDRNNTSKSENYKVEYVKTIISYIQKNYGEKIYIKDMAQQINMNEQYFCRFFKSMIGRSPIEYLNEYRVKKIEELLINSDRKIMDICLACGFNNMGNFINIFKKSTGMSPIRYRQKFKNKQS